MIKKIKYLLLLILISLLAMSSKSQARIYTNDPSVSSGDTVTITISSQEKVASGAISITSNGGLIFKSASGGQVNGNLVAFAGAENKTSGIATYTFKAPNVTGTKTFTVVFSSKDMANADGNSVASSSATASVTVKGTSSSGTSQPKPTEPSTPTPEPTKKPTFINTNQKVYAVGDINLRASYSTSSDATPIKKGEEMTLIGTSSEEVNGYVWYKVEYNGTTKYVANQLITTKKIDDSNEENKSKSNKLKLLTITPNGLTPEFDADITKYTMKVGVDVTEVKISASAEDEKANVSITGNKNLKIGTNTIEIKVTAEDKSEKIYKIIVTKVDKEKLTLSELLIEGLPLKPAFNADIYEYTLALERTNISDLNVTAIPSSEDAEVEIVGNTALKPGNNVITILVKSSDGEETVTYKVTVNVPEEKNIIQSGDKKLYAYIGIGIGAFVLLILIIALIKGFKKDDYYDEIYDDDIYRVRPSDNKFKGIRENSFEKPHDKSNNLEQQMDTNIDKDLPELEEDDLSQYLGLDNFKEKTNARDEEKIPNDAIEKQRDEENMSDETIRRLKKLDEFYSSQTYYDDKTKRKRGKHF